MARTYFEHLTRRWGVLILSLLFTVSILGLGGCADTGITFVNAGHSFTLAEMPELLEQTSTQDLEPVDDVAEARSHALVSLRSQGELAAQSADLITTTFPSNTYAVPYFVERASVEGTSSLIVIEAIGATGEPLEDQRLWVLDDDGNVLYSATHRR